ncbi:hypothetical protein LZ30DRAFT_596033 [Colletotrichum cereale]|nr:hypothetical protein LZ30DRAFT_596033 [Colletotrichum cereale]
MLSYDPKDKLFLLGSHFRPNETNPFWHCPTKPQNHLHNKQFKALSLALTIFNNDLDDDVISRIEKETIMCQLFQVPTETQMRGDFSSFVECRRVRRRHLNEDIKPDKLPTFDDFVFAAILYNLSPPLSWGPLDDYVTLLSHLQTHKSNNRQHAGTLDDKLAKVGRSRLQATATGSVNAAAPAPSTTSAKTLVIDASKMSPADKDLMTFLQKLTTNETLDDKWRVRGAIAELQTLGWDDLGKYVAKINDTTLPVKRRNKILINVMREVAARLAGEDGVLLPKDYTYTCECGKETTF